MEQIIIDLVTKYPKIVSILAAIGTLRLVFKPVMVALSQIVVSTETKKDDELLAKVEKSKIYKAFVFALDYIASIKIK